MTKLTQAQNTQQMSQLWQNTSPGLPPKKNRGFLTTQFPQDWRTKAKPFFEDPARWCLTLMGGFGSGKSCFAAAIQYFRMQKAMKANGIPQDAETIPYSVRGSWRNGDDLAKCMRTLDSWPSIRKQIVEANFLVIDDLGAARMTEHVKTETASLLMTRHREERKTIITTNMSLRDLAAEIDGRIESRLHDGIIIQTGDADLRKGATG